MLFVLNIKFSMRIKGFNDVKTLFRICNMIDCSYLTNIFKILKLAFFSVSYFKNKDVCSFPYSVYCTVLT